jgi:methylmalonyl-CoA epimerase
MELDHVGVAVADLDRAIARWQSILGPPEGSPEDVPSNRVRVVFLTAGNPHVELLTPLDPGSPVAKFLQHRGEGIHHLAFRVPSVDRTLDEIVRRGERVVDRVARPGARGRRVGFAHPTAFGGVLVEFVEGP